MTDLIARLRLVPRTVTTAGKEGIHCTVGEWCHEAAARIATLEAALCEVVESSWMADDEAFAAVCDKARASLAAPVAPRPKTLVEKMEEAVRQPIPYEGLQSAAPRRNCPCCNGSGHYFNNLLGEKRPCIDCGGAGTLPAAPREEGS